MARSKNMFAAPAKAKPEIPGAEVLLYSAERAATMLGVSASHIRALAKEGKLPHVRPGNRVMFCPEDLRKWAADQAAASVRQSA